MIIAVGSTNPVKLEAIRLAVEEVHTKLGLIGPVEFLTFAAESSVSDQPFSDEETRRGARHALQSLPDADLAFGLEGGVMEIENTLYSTIWIALIDRQGKKSIANGGRFPLPSVLVEALRDGQEMGPAMDEITGKHDIKHSEGMIGVVTGGVITRAQEYGHIAKCAYSLYHGPKL